MNATTDSSVVVVFSVDDWLESLRDQYRNDLKGQQIVALCAVIFKAEKVATIGRAEEVLTRALDILKVPYATRPKA